MDEFIDRMINLFADKITDEIFLMIQNNPELMHEYQRQADVHTLDALNRRLGELIPDRFRLGNLEDENGQVLRNSNPRSNLIRSYTRHVVI